MSVDIVDFEKQPLKIDYDSKIPLATIMLKDTTLTVSVSYDSKRGKWYASLKLYSINDGSLIGSAEVPADNLPAKIMQPRYAGFRSLLHDHLPKKDDNKRFKLSEFLSRLQPVVEKLKKLHEVNTEKVREDRRKRLEALMLKYKDEFDRINSDPIKAILEVVDVYHVGDEVPKHQLVLAIASRFLPKDFRLHVVIMGPSSVGKNNLVKAFLKVTPRKWWIEVTRITAHALDYINERIGRQILYIQEYEGIDQAKYSTRITLSEGKLSIAYVRRNEKTGELETVNKSLLGVPVLITTTTAIQIDEDMENRTFYINPDTSEEQTKRIIEHLQRLVTLEGKAVLRNIEGKAKILRLWFKTLRNYDVIIPKELSDKIVNEIPLVVRSRRDFKKLLAAVMSSAVLNQHRREKTVIDGQEYIIASEEDVEYVKKWFLGSIIDQISGLVKPLKDIMTYMENNNKEYIESVDGELQKYLGVSERTLRRYLNELVKRGFMIVDKSTKPYKYYLIKNVVNNPNLNVSKTSGQSSVIPLDRIMTEQKTTGEKHAKNFGQHRQTDQTHTNFDDVEGYIGHAYKKIVETYRKPVCWNDLTRDLMKWFKLDREKANELIKRLIEEGYVKEERIEGESEPCLTPVRD